MNMRKRAVGVALALLVASCADDQTAITRFREAREVCSKAIGSMVGSSYLYRLDVTPEEQKMAFLMNRISRGDRSAATEALALERERRKRYLDSFGENIEGVRTALVKLIEAANAIRDPEVRTTALDLSKFYEHLIETCAGVLSGQSHRSFATERFLLALLDNGPMPERRSLPEADSLIKRNQNELQRTYSREATLQAAFDGTVARKRSSISNLFR